MLYVDDVVVWCCFLYGEFAVHLCGSVFLVRFWFCYCSSDYFRGLSLVLFQSSHCCAYCCDCSSCCCRLFDLALALCFLAMFLDLFLCFPLYSRLCSCCPAWETQYSKQQAEEKTILYWRNKQIIHHKNIKPKQARRRRKRKKAIFHTNFFRVFGFSSSMPGYLLCFLTTYETLRKPFYVLVCWLMCYSYCCWLNVIVCLCLFLLLVVMLKVMVCCSVEFLVFCWHCRTFFQIFFQFRDVLSQTLDTVIPEAFLNLSSQPLPSKEAPCPKYLGSPIAPRPMP